MVDLKVAVEIGARDRFSGPAAKVRGAAGKLQKQFSGAQEELKNLGKQRAALDSLARLERGLGKSGTAFDAGRKRTAALRAQVRATASPSKKLADAFERSREKSSRLGSAHDRQRSKLRQLRGELRESGLATNRLSDAQEELDHRMRRASESVERARGTLAAGRMASARSRERFAQTVLALQGADGAGRSALRALAAPVRWPGAWRPRAGTRSRWGWIRPRRRRSRIAAGKSRCRFPASPQRASLSPLTTSRAESRTSRTRASRP